MRTTILVALFLSLVIVSCSKKDEFRQDYAIQHAAENDGDLNDPAQ